MANIIGLHLGHDGSVCLVRNGKLECAIATERITRIKKDCAFTDDVIDYILNETHLSLDDIDCVALNHNPTCKNDPLLGNEYLTQTFKIKDKEFKSYVVNHHLAHCSSVYYTSPFNDAYCFSMDCSTHTEIMGEPKANSLIAYGKGNQIFTEYCPNKMEGILYADVTERLGLGPALHKAGTTMGLASYGNPFEFDCDLYSDEIKLNSHEYLHQLLSRCQNHQFDWETCIQTDEIKYKMNVAATVQQVLEQVSLKVIDKLESKTENLCLSGGSFLNCNANSKIVNQSKFKNFHIYPACGDDGTSVGAALYVSHHILDEPRYDYKEKDLCYTGKEYKVNTPDYHQIAQELSNGKIIGWFQGKSEFGPRALGNRSILADPRNAHTRDIINHVVKKREWFRPFAPVVLEEYYQDWFDFPIPSPYMLYTAQVKQPEKIPAVTHVDGSARFQTINEDTNPHYYNVIKAFYELTGVPVLLNTSLNGNGQPILETPKEAIDFFKKSHLDMIFINGEEGFYVKDK